MASAACMRVVNPALSSSRGLGSAGAAPSTRHLYALVQRSEQRQQQRHNIGNGRRHLQLVPHAEGGAGGAAAVPPGDDAAGPAKQPNLTILQRVKRFFVGDGLDRERLKALGMGAFASYGFISNVNYGTALTIAWIAFVKKYGKSPLAEGQWPAFLAFYAGLWALQNFARPLRLSLAIALAPAFDRAIQATADRFGVSKGKGFGIFLACMAIVTSATMFSALYLLGGFPS